MIQTHHATNKLHNITPFLQSSDLAVFVDIVQELSLARNLETIMEIVRTAARNFTGADGATFVLRDGDLCFYADEDAVSPLWKGSRFPMSVCISGWVMLNKKIAAIKDIYKDDRIPADAYRPTFVKSLLMVPIRTKDPVGAIGNYWAAEHLPTAEETAILRALADVTSVAIENVQLYSQLEKRVEERTLDLQKTHEQLRHAEKLAAIGSLSASIAHEFNNPLQGLMTILKGVSRRSITDEDDKELVNIALQECSRMSELIKSLQDFNRPSSGKTALIDIHAAINSLLILGKKEYETKGIAIETKYAQNVPPIYGVSDQIKQVLLNLLNNATDACDNGGTVTIETQASKEKIIIKIHDTGNGIAPENIDHIFDPFFTTKPEIKGTGLGLSISYGIIKKHGGEITVASSPEKGICFAVSLPIKRDVVPDEKKENIDC